MIGITATLRGLGGEDSQSTTQAQVVKRARAFMSCSLTSSGRSVPSDPRRCWMYSVFPDLSISSSALFRASARSTWLRRRFFAAAAAALPRRMFAAEEEAAVRLALRSSLFTSNS